MVSVDKTVMEENNKVSKSTATEVLPDCVQPSSDLPSWL